MEMRFVVLKWMDGWMVAVYSFSNYYDYVSNDMYNGARAITLCNGVCTLYHLRKYNTPFKVG